MLYRSLAHDQEAAGLDIISDGRVQGDNYADQALYYYYKRLGYELKVVTWVFLFIVACMPPR